MAPLEFSVAAPPLVVSAALAVILPIDVKVIDWPLMALSAGMMPEASLTITAPVAVIGPFKETAACVAARSIMLLVTVTLAPLIPCTAIVLPPVAPVAPLMTLTLPPPALSVALSAMPLLA